MGQVVLLTRFRKYTVAGGTVNVAPTALSAISRPLGGGATIENFGSILANSVVGQTGLYYVELTDASYVDGSRYEVYCTATVSGSTVYGIQEFQFRASTADTDAPDPPTGVSVDDVTTTTATISFTAPTDADYDHSDASYHEEGSTTVVDVASFTGALTGLTPGASYVLDMTALDASGNRSLPSNKVRFTTLGFSSGDYQFKVTTYLDENETVHSSAEGNVALDFHRFPVGGRATGLMVDVEMVEVGQDLLFLGWAVEAEAMARRTDHG